MEQDFIGKYKITEMKIWDKDYIDMVVSAFVEIKNDGTIEFQFGVVHGFGNYSCCKEGRNIDSRWEGSDETDEIGGEIELEIDGGNMTGTISFDSGDVSDLVAVKNKP